MKVYRIPIDTTDDETRRLWDAAKRAIQERDMRDDECCVGDTSRCRCAPNGSWRKYLPQADES